MIATALVMGRKELVATLCVLLAVWAWFPPGDDRSPMSWKRVSMVCLLVVGGEPVQDADGRYAGGRGRRPLVADRTPGAGVLAAFGPRGRGLGS